MATETLILDATGSNIDGTNPGSPLTIMSTSANYWVTAASFPGPPVLYQQASSVDTDGSIPVSERHENRVISLTIECNDTASSSTHEDALRAKFAKIFRERGTLKRTRKDGSVRIYDLLTADQADSVLDVKYENGRAEFNLTLGAAPYARGVEQDLGLNTAATLPVTTFSEVAIPGDASALGRLVVTDTGGLSQSQVWWGVRSRYSSTASTAALFYQAEALTAGLATAAVGSSGATGSGSNALKNTSLLTSYTTGFLSSSAQFKSPQGTGNWWTHVGEYTVLTRVYVPATNTGTVTVAMEWQGAGQSVGTVNRAVAIDPVYEGNWVFVDLGMVVLPPALRGDQAWTMSVYAKSTVSGDDIEFDSVALIPAERSGRAVGVGGLPALWEGRGMEIRHDGVISQFDDPAPTVWAAAPKYEGDYLLVPPSGAESRAADFIVIVGGDSTGNVAASGSTQAYTTQTYVTPRYLT